MQLPVGKKVQIPIIKDSAAKSSMRLPVHARVQRAICRAFSRLTDQKAASDGVIKHQPEFDSRRNVLPSSDNNRRESRAVERYATRRVARTQSREEPILSS